MCWYLLCLQKSTANGDLSFSDVGKFSLDVLQQKDDLPDGVDKDRKEVGSLALPAAVCHVTVISWCIDFLLHNLWHIVLWPVVCQYDSVNCMMSLLAVLQVNFMNMSLQCSLQLICFTLCSSAVLHVCEPSAFMLHSLTVLLHSIFLTFVLDAVFLNTHLRTVLF